MVGLCQPLPAPEREIDVEDTAPKAQGAIGVVSGELDQREREVHADTVARWRLTAPK